MILVSRFLNIYGWSILRNTKKPISQKNAHTTTKIRSKSNGALEIPSAKQQKKIDISQRLNTACRLFMPERINL
jgi:hypothetical protein